MQTSTSRASSWLRELSVRRLSQLDHDSTVSSASRVVARSALLHCANSVGERLLDLTAKEVVAGLQPRAHLARERRMHRRRPPHRRDRLQENRPLTHDLGDAVVDRQIVIDGHAQM